jgi:hypothetical protein
MIHPMPRKPPAPFAHGLPKEAVRKMIAERLRVAAVAYLQARGGEPATVGEIAAGIGSSGHHLGPILEAARMSFRVRRVRASTHTGEVQMVELHPHLLPQRVLA